MDKNLDYKGRWRNKTVAFRVSEEEDSSVSGIRGRSKAD